MNTITRLNLWLQLEGNSKAKLAGLLGYESSETIQYWIRKKSIPTFQEANVIRIIKGESNVKTVKYQAEAN